MYFVDWLTVSQEHAFDLPVVCDVMTITIDTNTNEVLSTRQPRFKHEASYSTSVTIHVQGRKIRVEGNPSRVGRLDNLFGFSTIEQCVSVYNQLLAEYGLPGFTRCTRVDLRDGASGAKTGDRVADGAKIERIDLTTNVSVGEARCPHGVVRMEQELKNEFLQRECLAYWGLFDERRFAELHDEFLRIDERLKVTAMDIVSISEQLLAEQIVDTTRAANTTAMYAIQWMHGQQFDFGKKQVQTHAARLNRIGINIRNACDTSRFAPVFVRQAREITKSTVLAIPSWYQRPNHLQVAA